MTQERTVRQPSIHKTASKPPMKRSQLHGLLPTDVGDPHDYLRAHRALHLQVEHQLLPAARNDHALNHEPSHVHRLVEVRHLHLQHVRVDLAVLLLQLAAVHANADERKAEHVRVLSYRHHHAEVLPVPRVVDRHVVHRGYRVQLAHVERIVIKIVVHALPVQRHVHLQTRLQYVI